MTNTINVTTGIDTSVEISFPAGPQGASGYSGYSGISGYSGY